MNLRADSHSKQSPREAFKQAEEEKERKYKDRIHKIENGSFTPMIFSSNGARAIQTREFIARLVTRIALKRKEQRMDVAARMSIQLSFIFIKHSLICLRGHRDGKSGFAEQLQ